VVVIASNVITRLAAVPNSTSLSILWFSVGLTPNLRELLEKNLRHTVMIGAGDTEIARDLTAGWL
jgi:hypothetical protein